MKHVIIASDKNFYFGQPANGGAWIWDNEILLRFSQNLYEYKENDNNFDRGKGAPSDVLARSFDGGETWQLESGENLEKAFVGEPKNGKVIIDFSSKDLCVAVKEMGDVFAVSFDRGRSWTGPFELPKPTKKIKCRTDYIVNGSGDCTFFLSSRPKGMQVKTADRAFAARTRDGGATFEILGDITTDPARSVMPATVKVDDNTLVTAVRRRWDADFELDDNGEGPKEFKSRQQLNWIALYQSKNEGRTWKYLSMGAVTDPTGTRNGNPPALVKLKDGRLVLAYGYRGEPTGIKARISIDNGETWSSEKYLRDDASHWDIGYCRMVQRPDGKLVTMYYYATEGNPIQHIEATIWLPEEIWG